MRYLLDTNIVSYHLRRTSIALARRPIEALRSKECHSRAKSKNTFAISESIFDLRYTLRRVNRDNCRLTGMRKHPVELAKVLPFRTSYGSSYIDASVCGVSNSGASRFGTTPESALRETGVSAVCSAWLRTTARVPRMSRALLVQPRSY